MVTVAGYGAPSAGAPLEKVTIERRATGPDDILIAVEYAGICHSDIHTVRGEWGERSYPLTPGHEIVGIVTEIGSNVTGHVVGERVGVGCLVGSCGECRACVGGEENYCLNRSIGTYGSTDVDGTITQGGYSTHIVVNQRFVVHVPDALDPASTAPLLCAGITTYSPLKHWNIGKGSKVGIIGMGGLGHVAVQIAVALGADVVVLSHSLSKKDDGLKFGATDFISTQDQESLARYAGHFDFLLSTISVTPDVPMLLKLLSYNGTVCFLGLPTDDRLTLRGYSLIGKRKAIAGSDIGGIPETQEMLDFCAEHGISAQIELIDASQINDAYERIVHSQVRYRAVIDATTF
ncbi:MAG: NAD(P)-dependent alcohol dehydrogenase [Propionibacteriaceae bacterium]